MQKTKKDDGDNMSFDGISTKVISPGNSSSDFISHHLVLTWTLLHSSSIGLFAFPWTFQECSCLGAWAFGPPSCCNSLLRSWECVLLSLILVFETLHSYQLEITTSTPPLFTPCSLYPPALFFTLALTISNIQNNVHIHFVYYPFPPPIRMFFQT